jgi:hypothetical protein
VGKTLNILFSQPPAGVSDEEYNTWYDAHLPEILSIPGFVAAQRFRLDPPEGGDTGPVPFTYLAIYEIDTGFEEAMAEMERQSLASYEQYQARKRRDPSVGPPIPEWFPEIRFAWWVGVAVSDRVVADDA